MARIGLVAGNGELPLIFAKKAKEMGDTVIALGLKGVTSEELEKYVEKVYWFEWGDLKKAMLLAVTQRLRKIALLGKIRKEMLFKDSGKFDDESKKIVGSSGGKKDYNILKGVAGLVKTVGIEIIDPTPYLEELIPAKSILTKRIPAKEEELDVEYGRKVASELARFDIGQTVIVKDKTVIALEAVEGTDETIVRAGKLVDGGFTVVKMARPSQDARFDVPLVGLETVKAIIQNRGKVLALEQKRTFLMNKEEAIRLADESGLSIIVI
ncbi:MAG: UDP-2,3-diacylglucosamine diphosphatase LpxI [Candidatus Omnitrophota bacterium]|nr:UDP-2,3-diacylglucosamine diphosphatase LpxI [Candidatus Omnitrophota bacterium]